MTTTKAAAGRISLQTIRIGWPGSLLVLLCLTIWLNGCGVSGKPQKPTNEHPRAEEDTRPKGATF
jgi:hypothetical protein